ncbi:probable UDP-3-O-acylglucosamine N-acyltransferase 1, mitochondrial isoform X1 [Brassica napus]|uniref:probable UDP-3-O-acylglucosamine N-acyltransferase 1, mitochondrial isoform X1 n=1 Tax=Brassica napus TaxID=3708 RepID=UPI0006AAB4AB|nr:probable UDP-3-O-acylglucosamine N-acyltransferase 1, mitochondrial isoform X1 [Brassica napus]
MATNLRRLFSVSAQGVLLKKKLPGSFSSCRNLCVCSGQTTESITVTSSPYDGLETSLGGDADKGFLRWGNGGGTYHSSAVIDSSALVEFGAVVHEKAILGAEVHVGSNTVVGPSVKIGPSTKIGYNVSVSNCSIGELCVIHNGVCVGQDGFGFYVDDQGNMVKKPQALNVKIGNRVEIGANTCIDRGSWRETVIGDDTKIDNLVQIGHNVVIGKSCLLCGQVGIAGSAEIGDYVVLGGRVAVRDHVSIVSKVRLAANSCVTKSITEPGDFGGFPAVSISLCLTKTKAKTEPDSVFCF